MNRSAGVPGARASALLFQEPLQERNALTPSDYPTSQTDICPYPRCKGFLLTLTNILSGEPETRCVICKRAPHKRLVSKSLSSWPPQKRAIHSKPKASVADLTKPPRRPTRNADSNEWSCYAASLHFYDQAQHIRKQRELSKSKRERAKFLHKCRLFEDLAKTLDQLRTCWIKIRKGYFLLQQKSGDGDCPIPNKRWHQLHRRYWLVMRQAMTLAPADPFVQRFTSYRRGLGNYDYLLAARKGLQRGATRPYRSPEEADIDTEINALQLEGKGARKIHRSLKNRAATWEAQKSTNKLIKVQPEPFSPSSIPTHQAIEKRVKAFRKTSAK